MTTSVGSGIGSSFGLVSEATWGTWVTPIKWLEHESETIAWQPKRIVGKGLYNGGLVQRNANRQTVTSTVAGDLVVPVYYKGKGLLLGAAMGSIGVAPVQQLATSAYLQTHALANNFGQSLSLQIGRPDTAGLIHQYNYRGCKVIAMKLECGVGEYLLGTYTVDGQAFDQTGAYGAPVYQSGNGIFAFNQATLRIGAFGNEVLVEGIRKFGLTWTRPMKVDNFYMDGSGLKQQQVQNGFGTIAVALESDYLSDSAFVAQFTADTAQSLVVDFLGGTIATGTTKTITGVTAASTGAIVTATAHGYTNGQVVTIASVTGTGSPNPNTGGNNPAGWVIDTVTTNTFRIGLNTTGFTYVSGGSATQVNFNQFSVQVPNLRWDGEPPKVGGPDIIMPKLALAGLYDDSHTPATLLYVSTDTTQ